MQNISGECKILQAKGDISLFP